MVEYDPGIGRTKTTEDELIMEIERLKHVFLENGEFGKLYACDNGLRQYLSEKDEGKDPDPGLYLIMIRSIEGE